MSINFGPAASVRQRGAEFRRPLRNETSARDRARGASGRASAPSSRAPSILSSSSPTRPASSPKGIGARSARRANGRGAITGGGLPGGLDARQSADAARVNRPDLEILLITGFAENAPIGNGQLEAGMALPSEPFPLDTQAAPIRGSITSRRRTRSA